MSTLARQKRDEKPGRSAHRALTGLSGGFTLGGLPVAAPLLALLIPTTRLAERPPYLRRLMLFAVMAGSAALISSLINSVEISVSSVASPLVLAFLLWGYCKATVGVPSALFTMCLTAASTVAAVLLLSGDSRVSTLEGTWKYGIAFPATFIALYLVVAASERRAWAYAILGAVSALSLQLGFRSHALICLVVLVLVLARGQAGRRFRLVGIGAASAGLWAIATYLPRAMAEGYFGMELQARMLRQTAGSTPLILGGRTEAPLSLAAIAEKPLLGWGNAQTLDRGVISDGMTIASNLGMSNPEIYLPFWVRPGGFVSLHSILLGLWVEGGVLAAVLPVALIVLFTVAVVRTSGRWAPLVMLVSAQGVWDLVFSPWAGNRLVLIALSAVIALWSVHESREARDAIGLGSTVAPPNPTASPLIKRRSPAAGR